MKSFYDRILAILGGAFVATALLAAASPTWAGEVLFVSDSLTDAINIPVVLSGGSEEVDHPTIAGAGLRPAATANDHNVTIIRNDYQVSGGEVFLAEGSNPALAGTMPDVDLSDYCSVYWSASGPHQPNVFDGGFGADGGLHTDALVFSNLGTYVADGGYVLVTGHDAATDPADTLLEEYVGGAGAVAVQLIRSTPNAAPFGVVSGANNALASGVVDIAGLSPGADLPGGVNSLDGVQDLDYIGGVAIEEVTGVVIEPMALGGFLWTERVPLANGGVAAASDLQQGRVAYVANGVFLFEDLPFNPGTLLSDGEDPSWTGDPAYRGALLNFAFNACDEPNTPPIANDDDYVMPQDTELNIAAPGVLANDSDAEGDELSVASNSEASNGDVALATNGALNYTPNRDFCGLDSFTYLASDGSDQSNPATVRIDVQCDEPPGPRQCDANSDASVDLTDIRLITAARNQPADGADDPRDVDGDGTITVLDARACVRQCDLPRCATAP